MDCTVQSAPARCHRRGGNLPRRPLSIDRARARDLHRGGAANSQSIWPSPNPKFRSNSKSNSQIPMNPCLGPGPIVPIRSCCRTGSGIAEEFLDAADEAELLVERFEAAEFHEVRMRGVTARRRVVQYGWKYSFESFRMTEGPRLPDLVPLRDTGRRASPGSRRRTLRSARHRILSRRGHWLAP